MWFFEAPAQPPAAVADTASIKTYDAAFFADFKPDTAFDMVRKLPAFVLDYGASVRGFAGSDSNVRIDGQQPASRDAIDAVLRRIPASAVARIEIISGSAPGVDMQGRSVVANVVRREGGGGEIKGTASATFGVNELRRRQGGAQIQAERRVNGRSLEGSLAYNRYIDEAEGLRLRGLNLDQPASYLYRSGSDNTSATGALETPLIGGQLRLSTALTGQHSPNYRQAGGASPSNEFNANHAEQGEVSAQWTRNAPSGGFLQLIAFQQLNHTRSAQDFTQGGSEKQFGVEYTKGETILRAIGRSAAHGQFVFDGSLEGDYNWLDTASRYSVNGVDVPLPAGQVRVTETRGEALVNLTWTPRSAISIQMGARAEGSHIASAGVVSLSKTRSYIKPRFVTAWTMAPGRTLTMKVERQVGQLSFDDFSAAASLTNGTIVAGNPDLEPSITTLYEARFEQRFAGRGAFVVQYSHRDIDAVVARNILHTPQGDYEASDNIGSGWKDSLGFSLTAPLDRFHFKGGQLKAGATLRDSELTDPLTGQKHVFSYESAYDYSIAISQDAPGSRINWNVEVLKTSVYPYWLTTEVDSIERSHQVNVQVDYKLRPDLGLRFEALALTDWRYNGTREIYSAPRDAGVVVNRELMRSHQIGNGRMLRFSLRKTF